MSNPIASSNDPALGSFIRFIEKVALCTRLNYIKRLRLLHDHEIVTDSPLEFGAESDSLDTLDWSLTEISADIVLHTAISKLTSMEKKTLALSILEDRPMEEIAALLHISLSRAYQLRRNALEKLQNALRGGK